MPQKSTVFRKPARLLCPWNSPDKNPGVNSIPFSRESSQPWDRTQVSCNEGRFFTVFLTREALRKEQEKSVLTKQNTCYFLSKMILGVVERCLVNSCLEFVTKLFIVRMKGVSRSVVSNSLWPPWTVVRQVPLSMEFSKQEYLSGFPFPSPGDLFDSGMEPGFPTFQADSLPSEPPGKPKLFINKFYKYSYCKFINYKYRYLLTYL